jgi:hypothetical protein
MFHANVSATIWRYNILFACLFLTFCLNLLHCSLSSTATPKYTEVGCFQDVGTNRALPKYIKNLRPEINWKDMNATIEACSKLAKEHNSIYFAIQYYGECWGAKPGTVPDYDKHGPANNCWNGVGAVWSNFVYRLE